MDGIIHGSAADSRRRDDPACLRWPRRHSLQAQKRRDVQVSDVELKKGRYVTVVMRSGDGPMHICVHCVGIPDRSTIRLLRCSYVDSDEL